MQNECTFPWTTTTTAMDSTTGSTSYQRPISPTLHPRIPTASGDQQVAHQATRPSDLPHRAYHHPYTAPTSRVHLSLPISHLPSDAHPNHLLSTPPYTSIPSRHSFWDPLKYQYPPYTSSGESFHQNLHLPMTSSQNPKTVHSSSNLDSHLAYGVDRKHFEARAALTGPIRSRGTDQRRPLKSTFADG